MLLLVLLDSCLGRAKTFGGYDGSIVDTSWLPSSRVGGGAGSAKPGNLLTYGALSWAIVRGDKIKSLK